MEQRLIDANKAKVQIMEDKIPENYMSIMIATGSGLQAETLNQACDRHIKMLDEQPTVDAVEVVRCKDCKYLNIINKAPLYAYCGKSNYIFHLFEEDTREHFCSWGEKELEAM